MSELKDPAIKLFGMTIPLPPNEQASAATATRTTAHFHAVDDDGDVDGDQEQQQQQSSSHRNLLSPSTSSSPRDRLGEAQLDSKKPSGSELTEARQEDCISHPNAEEFNDPAASRENTKTPSVDKEHTSPKVSKDDEQRVDGISQDKTLKKPDKILPCPRCNSMDTKFCYYNNYNVNQPRHFCKKCQRYWTAGGTMRNVPVGSGRRKSKSCAASHYRHILVSEALQAAQAEATNGIHHPTLRTNGTVLNFGSDAPVCESMTSSLNLADKSQNCAQNCFHRCEQKNSLSCGGQENGDDNSSKSSITGSDSADKGGNSIMQESVMTNFQALPPQVPCFPAPPWPSPWNPPQWRSTMPSPTFGPSGFPITFYPAPPPYWGCTLSGSWNAPWLSPPSSSPDRAVCSGPNSQILGKRSREGDMIRPSNSDNEQPLKEDNAERCIWVPKTLRIDNPSEAAKSSIWSTLGIKNEKSDSINRGVLFKAFQTKGGGVKHASETSLLLQANPAALSRSLHFQESV